MWGWGRGPDRWGGRAEERLIRERPDWPALCICERGSLGVEQGLRTASLATASAIAPTGSALGNDADGGFS